MQKYDIFYVLHITAVKVC